MVLRRSSEGFTSYRDSPDGWSKSHLRRYAKTLLNEFWMTREMSMILLSYPAGCWSLCLHFFSLSLMTARQTKWKQLWIVEISVNRIQDNNKLIKPKNYQDSSSEARRKDENNNIKDNNRHQWHTMPLKPGEKVRKLHQKKQTRTIRSNKIETISKNINRCPVSCFS